MGWILTLLIWLVAPFAELAIIIGLLVSNGKYKTRIRELEGRQMRYNANLGRWQNAYDPIESGEAADRGTFAEPGAAGMQNQGEIENVRRQNPGETEFTGFQNQKETEPVRTQNRDESEFTRFQSQGEWNSARREDPEEAEFTGIPSIQNEDEAKSVKAQNPVRPEFINAPLPVVSTPATAQNLYQETTQWTEMPRQCSDMAGGLGYQNTQGRGKKLLEYGRSNLGTLALVMGVIFTVLAGLIFATTTWHILPDICKTFLVLACSILFFAASFGAQQVFHIRKTSYACYILGSIFLFLSVVAAAYFRLLGPEFILDGENRWKVLWVGSVVTVGAFLAGLEWFDDTVYTQATLWGMSISLFFMAKAFSMGWDSFVFVMMGYSTILIMIKEYPDSFETKKEKKHGFWRILSEGFRWFAPIHFWTFSVITALRGLCSIWRMITEGCMGYRDGFLDRFFLFSFTNPGLGAMIFLMAGICILAEKKKSQIMDQLRSLAIAELVLYSAGWISTDFVYCMAVTNLGFWMIRLIRWEIRRQKGLPREESHSLFSDLCGCGALMMTLISFYMDKDGRIVSLALCLTAFAVYYLWFYYGSRQWPHLLAAIGILPLPWIAGFRMEITADQLNCGVGAVILLSAIIARRFYPIAKRDETVQGMWRMDWYQIVSIWIILWMAVSNDGSWRFVYLLLAALYFVQYRAVESLRKAAYSLSACFLALAFWQQPFVVWPQVLYLECSLLPVVWLIWTAGRIWEESSWIRPAQNAGYVMCLLLLSVDALLTGQVWDALILEGICLMIFLWSQIKNKVWWGRISAGMILAVALFMTRSFWLSISWWVYLLAAGIGLIVFAAIMEKRR